MNSGGSQAISGGTASNTTLNGGAQYVTSAGTNSGRASGTMVNSGGSQVVSAGGTAVGTVVDTEFESFDNLIGGVISTGLFAGGVTSNTLVKPGGSEVVEAGGTANGTTLSGGTGNQPTPYAIQFVASGGKAVGTAVGGGAIYTGNEIIVSGGSSTSATMNSGGAQWVFGTADFATVNAGGDQVIAGGGGGFTSFAGQHLTGPGTATSTTLNGGFQDVGGTAIATIVNSGGDQILTGGTASGTVVNSGGAQHIAEGHAGGTAINTTVNSGGVEVVNAIPNNAGALSIGTTVNAGGTEYVYGATDTQEDFFGIGTASATTVDAGGTEYVGSGGKATDTTISGGLLHLAAGALVGGIITFGTGSGTLQIDDTKTPGNTISGFAPGDTIDLASLNANSVSLGSGNVLTLGLAGNGSVTLHLDPAQSFANEAFLLNPDGNVGTDVTVVPDIPPTLIPIAPTNLSVGQPSPVASVKPGLPSDVLHVVPVTSPTAGKLSLSGGSVLYTPSSLPSSLTTFSFAVADQWGTTSPTETIAIGGGADNLSFSGNPNGYNAVSLGNGNHDSTTLAGNYNAAALAWIIHDSWRAWNKPLI